MSLWQHTCENQLKRGKTYFGLVSEVSVYGQLVSLFQAYYEAEYHGREQLIEQSCSSHGGQEAERERETPAPPNPFWGHDLNNMKLSTSLHLLQASTTF
jgi:hypothetical protein